MRTPSARRIRGVVFTLCLSAAVLGAQVPAVTVTGGRIIRIGISEDAIPVEIAELMALQGESLATAEAPATGARSQRLKTLEFDRRPSSILVAWVKPPADEGAASRGAVESRMSSDSRAAVRMNAADAAEWRVAESRMSESRAAESRAADSGAADSRAVDPAAVLAAESRRAAEAAEKAAAEAKALEAEISAFQRNVTLGDWTAVRAYLASLSKEDGKAAYERLLQSLADGPAAAQQVHPEIRAYAERNRFAAADVLGLAAAATFAPEKAAIASFGRILAVALADGMQLDVFLTALRPMIGSENFLFDRRKVAQTLAAAGALADAGEFLPTPEEAESSGDREALNLLSRRFLALNAKDGKVEWLERAWRTTQAALASGDISEEDKNEALRRAVDLAPKLKKDLGAAWLDESFTNRPDRGKEILAAIGASSALAIQTEPRDVEGRKKKLELQTSAAKALMLAAPDGAKEWSATLELLAGNWLREALVTYALDEDASSIPRQQRDFYGNFYYGGWNRGEQEQIASPIKTSDILANRPDDAWLKHVNEAWRPRFHAAFAQLLLKAGDESAAFPYIEALASSHPEPAKDLVDEFLRVWAKHHDPNSETQRSNPYIYMFGFDERANGIPLTRSKQERNLKELGEWVARLRKLPIALDETLLTRAFTVAHSSAEVYRLEAVEGVFGPIKDLKPAVLASLAQSMRGNLASVWRSAATHERAKTKRKQPEIEQEIERGYELLHRTLDRAMEAHPKSWELALADAATLHDENNYRAERTKSAEFSSKRTASFERFKAAADLYAAGVETIEREKETISVYASWFYAALGASDLAALTHEQTLASAQIPQIRTALAALPGERASRHADMFSGSLFSRMSSAKPAVKFRYIREGLAIAGDNPLAREAKQVFDYYSDLVTEIRLETRIDGADRVGHGAPFGLAIDLVHSKEIERESGGFGKYLQNQNALNFSYNYGRPTEDYRDKFEEGARAALKEHFDVVSITFNHPDVKSRATSDDNWRVTPYAFALLKAKGPEVDRVPSLNLNLDFLDTSGYAVIPVASAALPIDAGPAVGDARPYSKLKLVHTLDERHAKDGKLVLEIKASARGLLPDLDTLVDPTFAGFDVAKREDGGNSVVKFDEESAAPEVNCERLFTLTLKAKTDGAGPVATFAFPKARVTEAEIERFRYEDADLVAAAESVSLERALGKASRTKWWVILALAAFGLAGFVAWRRKKPATTNAEDDGLPKTLTPFSVLGYLRGVERREELTPSRRDAIAAEIVRLEEHYFGDSDGASPDLAAVVATWSAKR